VSRITKRKAMRRNKIMKVRKHHKKAFFPEDELAMMAANIDQVTWQYLPQHQKQLYRLRAHQALRVFSE